ncbi:PHP domain-containing protein [Paenibacillus sp. 7541]|uniref:PHP domain-containing protein n=1 Tax=Paenibacillus TaxID=44249 RepID=UPI000BA7071B|nr:PHP domain-containing protein [Paenibacillus sp. 7541]PAK52286.1 histidinol-phosphatase [Paenibacillus sp. 7541]
MKIDLHTHAKLSKASDFSPEYYEEMLREAKDSGLDALALTEHFNTRNFYEVYSELDRLFPYQGDYYEAYGLKIFPGMEVDILENGHILLIGSKWSILEVRRKLDGYTDKGAFIPFDQLMDIAEAYPLLKIGAHPFRDSTPLHHLSPRQLARLDAFDLNAKDMYQYGCDSNQERVQRFASELGKPVTAGSDTHQCLQFGSIFNELDTPCESAVELKEAILQGKYKLHVSTDLEIKVKASVMLKKLMKRMVRLEQALSTGMSSS